MFADSFAEVGRRWDLQSSLQIREPERLIWTVIEVLLEVSQSLLYLPFCFDFGGLPYVDPATGENLGEQLMNARALRCNDVGIASATARTVTLPD